MRWMTCIVLIISSFSLFAQIDNQVENDPLVGRWTGVITHPGGFRSEYIFHLEVIKDKEGYKCWSMVKVDNIFAEMSMTGTSFDKELFILKDTEILANNSAQGMEWCMKKYVLRLIQDEGVLRLEGDWDGTTSFGICEPGKVHIAKTPPRA